MATLGKGNNTNFLPRGNTPKPGIITPKSKVIAEKTMSQLMKMQILVIIDYSTSHRTANAVLFFYHLSSQV